MAPGSTASSSSGTQICPSILPSFIALNTAVLPFFVLLKPDLAQDLQNRTLFTVDMIHWSLLSPPCFPSTRGWGCKPAVVYWGVLIAEKVGYLRKVLTGFSSLSLKGSTRAYWQKSAMIPPTKTILARSQFRPKIPPGCRFTTR